MYIFVQTLNTMTNQEKAELYDALTRQGDDLNRELSKLKSNNIGIDDTPEKTARIKEINESLKKVQNQLQSLVMNG